MIKTLQRKFIMTAMTAITLLLVILLGILNTVNVWVTDRETDNMLEFLSRIPAVQGFPGFYRFAEHRNPWGRTLTEDDAMSARYFIAYFDADGQVERVDLSRIASVSMDEAAALAAKARAKGNTGKIGNFKYAGIASAYTRADAYIFLDISSKYTSITRIVILSLAAGIVCWLLMFLLLIFLSGRAIKPIAENILKQRQFVTDAGHEIKTPLAIILANTDAMELYSGETKWSKNIRTQTVRLSGLMQNLLILARADEGKQVVSPEECDLSVLLEKSIATFEEPMKQKQLILEKDVMDNVTVYADKGQLSSLLSILLDNAVKYSAANSTVVVGLTDDKKHIEVKIENTCESLPSCAPAQLFDRFYRGDKARTQKKGGYGIGLSAAKAIVETCHGYITARYLPENRIAFIVCLQKDHKISPGN